jgi:hypothetical protein
MLFTLLKLFESYDLSELLSSYQLFDAAGLGKDADEAGALPFSLSAEPLVTMTGTTAPDASDAEGY